MTAAARVIENPFLVLGVAPTATRIEIEREAQKLLGMLELGLESAAHYDTPLGPRPRTAELVRAAVALLRDPAKRLAAELWAASVTASDPSLSGVDAAPSLSGVDAAPSLSGVDADDGPPGWPQALARAGWRRP
jgi:hypothetical protein